MSRPAARPRAPQGGPAMDPAAPRLQPSVFPWPIFGWEYHELSQSHGDLWSDQLNKLGLEGWELVSVLHDESSQSASKTGYTARLLFKRPRPDIPNEDELRALGWKNPEVFTTWQEEARERYAALMAGPRAQAQGRVIARPAPSDDEEG